MQSRAALVALLVVLPCFGQDLPDPGRRLTPEEQKADPEKRPARPPAPRRGERDAKACANARTYYQMVCGPAGSRRSYSVDCTEAHALYLQSCP